MRDHKWQTLVHGEHSGYEFKWCRCGTLRHTYPHAGAPRVVYRTAGAGPLVDVVPEEMPECTRPFSQEERDERVRECEAAVIHAARGINSHLNRGGHVVSASTCRKVLADAFKALDAALSLRVEG